VGGWVPTHYQVKLQLQMRLSWAVTIIGDRHKIFENSIACVSFFLGHPVLLLLPTDNTLVPYSMAALPSSQFEKLIKLTFERLESLPDLFNSRPPIETMAETFPKD
jgi:hypothetical protein